MPQRELTDLADAVTRLGVPLPPKLARLYEIAEALGEAIVQNARAVDPLDTAVKEGTLATMDTAEIVKAVVLAAETQAPDAEVPRRAKSVVDRLFDAYEATIRHGGAADEIIDAVRPLFDMSVVGLNEANLHLSPDDTPETLLTKPDAAEAVSAWKSIQRHRSRLDAIYRTVLVPMVRNFGAGGWHDYQSREGSTAAAFACTTVSTATTPRRCSLHCVRDRAEARAVAGTNWFGMAGSSS